MSREINRREFLQMLATGIFTVTIPEIKFDSPSNIRQFGIEKLALNGYLYKLQVKPNAIQEYTTMISFLRYGTQNVYKVREWLQRNILDINLLDKTEKQVGYRGIFLEPNFSDSGNPAINLTIDAIKDVYTLQTGATITNDNDTFPHELVHLVDWIDNPNVFKYDSAKAVVKGGIGAGTLAKTTIMVLNNKDVRKSIGILTTGTLGLVGASLAMPQVSHDSFYKSLPNIISQNSQLNYNTQNLIEFKL